jgi:hypothetical protein
MRSGAVMFKIEGLDELQQELSEAAKAMEEMEGTLGTVSFDPHDPSSIEAAIAGVGRLIDERLSSYAGNSLIGPMTENLKEKYREGILEKAAAARLKRDD